MHISSLVGKTLRHPPSEAVLASHQLLVRAGYVRGVDGGRFAYLPLGQRTLHRLRERIGRWLAALGGQEVWLPAAADASAEELLIRLAGREVDSYRQLPVLLFQTAVRAVPQFRGRSGLFGAAERPVLDIFRLTGAEIEEEEPVAAILNELGEEWALPLVWAEVHTRDRAAFYPHPAGDEELAHCPSCGYAAVRSWARTVWPEPPDEPELPVEEVATPGCDTIAALADFLGIPAWRTLKVVFYSVEGRVTCVVIRGDRAVDNDKLARALGTDRYYLSLEEELAAVGAVGGYASPMGLDRRRVRVIADPSVRSGRNLVSGANRPDYHLRNVNLPRDFEPDEWVDLALIEPGDPCPGCGSGLTIYPAFSLILHRRPTPCGPSVEYLDAEGRSHPLWLASWQIDLARLLAALVEAHHDEHGIVWPRTGAPFDVHLLALDVHHEAVAARAQAVYERLQSQGWAVLYDDRNVSAGVKFHDADLIGIPLRLTVGKRLAQEGLVEARWRDGGERVTLDDAGLEAELARLKKPS